MLTNHQAFGWASGPDGARVRLEARLDGQMLAGATADTPRADLAAAGHGDGRYGFSILFPRNLSDRELQRVVLVEPVSGAVLPCLPGALMPGGIVALGDMPAPVPGEPRTRSPFGGLWTDRSDAADILAAKLRQGQIAEAEHALLSGWIADGYVILPGAIPSELCDRVLEDIERAVRGDIALWREMAGIGTGATLVPAAGERRGKLIDLYVKSQAALDLILHARIARFLALVFDRPALAFQAIAFEYGSQQRLHQDTAFVPVSAPLELAASWTALEDIKEGSGELVYVPGSQAIPDFLFDGAFRLMSIGSTEEDAFHAYLDAEVAARKLERKRFLAKKGDVLIWSADLAHGGSPIRDAAAPPTRRSLVAHYCPIDRRPAYFKPGCTIAPHASGASSTYAIRPY